MKMVRKQVYITEEQDALLKRLSAATGLTEAELVRTALERLSEVTYEADAGNVVGRLRETALMERYTTDEATRTGMKRIDDAAWQAEVAFMRSLRARDEAEAREGGTWKFDRDEGYEERLDKILCRH